MPNDAPWVTDESLDEQLDNLASWSVNAPAPLAIHALIAEAGAGKTTFARHLIARVRDENPGYSAEFLDNGPLPTVPSLLVADGAGSMVPLIRRAGRAAIQSGVPLRLLLLERQGSRNHGWLYDLLGDPWVGDEFSAYAFEVPSTVATPGGEQSREIFEVALAAWSRELGQPVPAFDPKPFDMRPPHEGWHNPGYLWMAARESYRASPEKALRLPARTLSQRETPVEPSNFAEVVHDAIESGNPDTLSAWLGTPLSRDDLHMADGLLPYNQPALSALANKIASRLAEVVRGSESPPVERARALRNLALRFSNLDRPADAAEAATGAAAIYRRLGAGYVAHLADALIRQGAETRAAGKPSVDVTREAVDLSLTLDDDPMRARALSHHGDSLAAAGQWKEAYNSYRGAIQILKREFPHLSNRAMGLLSATIDDYRRACERLGHAPDASLIGSFDEFFAR